MFLSMHMIADRLEGYHPEIHISEGKRTISTVRIIADDIYMSSSTVYLHQASPSTIVCASGPDYIIISCDDINIILNHILDAFEYYNDWEAALMQRIREGCTLEDVLEAGIGLLNRYLVLADPTFLIYESYGKKEWIDCFPSYQRAIHDKMLPLNELLTINQSKHIRTPDIPSYEVPVPSMQINTIVTNLFSFTKHNGWLITNNTNGTYTQNDKDLQDAFSELLQTWMSYNEQSREKTDRENIFRDLLDGNPMDDSSFSRLEVFHWYRTDEKQLYVIQGDPSSSENPLYAVIRMIEHLNPYGFIFFYEEHLVYVIDIMLQDMAEHDRQLTKILSSSHCVAGKSPRFTNLNQLPRQHIAAKTTASYAFQQNLIIADVTQIFIPYLQFLIKENSVLPLLHADLEILKKYDQANQTDLYHTLRLFLRNQLNYTKTANDLFIHRSTLLYRISRIQDLINFDTEDYDHIFQLELSFMLFD